MDWGISTERALGDEELLLAVSPEGASTLAGFVVFAINQPLPSSFHIV
jgi:hypothetical protein